MSNDIPWTIVVCLLSIPWYLIKHIRQRDSSDSHIVLYPKCFRHYLFAWWYSWKLGHHSFRYMMSNRIQAKCVNECWYHQLTHSLVIRLSSTQVRNGIPWVIPLQATYVFSNIHHNTYTHSNISKPDCSHYVRRCHQSKYISSQYIYIFISVICIRYLYPA